MLVGANKLVLEVTCGKGAFMKKREKAEELSRMMKELGEISGIETVCLITNMDQPIGKAIRKFFRDRGGCFCFKRTDGRRCEMYSFGDSILHFKACWSFFRIR